MEGCNIRNIVTPRRSAAPRATFPFIKWPGGKRWLTAYFRQRCETLTYDRYIEPFLGGGAVFFSLRPKKALLSDINSELINVYLETKYRPSNLISLLKPWSVTAEKYLEIRNWHPSRRDYRAARFLYLNRTCFSGMYRVNRQGRFNVPFGGGQRTPSCLWERELLKYASGALKCARLRVADFEDTLKKAGPGDLVYCDPAYTVSHNNNGFIRYNESVFTWADQIRLASACAKAKRRGAKVFVSNANHGALLDLYPSAIVHTLERMSLLTPVAKKRRLIDEVLLEL